MSELDVANERRVRTLHAEIETAAVMMALVKYTREPDLVRKYKDVAVRSYLSALDLVVISTFLPTEKDEVCDELAPIRRWLEQERLLESKQADAAPSVIVLLQPCPES